MVKFIVLALLIPALLTSCGDKIESKSNYSPYEKTLVLEAVHRCIHNVKNLDSDKWGNFPQYLGKDYRPFPPNAQTFTKIFGVTLDAKNGTKTYLVGPPETLDEFLAVDIDISKGKVTRVFYLNGPRK